MNRFKGFDLVNRVPEEYGQRPIITVQEGANKTIPKKKKCKNAEWLSEEALQIVEERREVKSKRESERYMQLNAEFQRVATRNKKDFFNEQCKEIEENNKKGKARDFSKKTENFKGIFHPKMGTTKDINGKDLIEAEEIKKRWKKYMREQH